MKESPGDRANEIMRRRNNSKNEPWRYNCFSFAFEIWQHQ